MYTIAFWDDLPSLQNWLASDDYKHSFLGALRPFLTGSQSVSVCDVRGEGLAGVGSRVRAGAPAQ